MAPVALPDDWRSAGVAITCGYETSSTDPYAKVVGDFDGMGISCGALQWNIGMKSLQPMVKAVGKTRVQALMPTHGAKMWEACAGTVKDGLAIVRGWQSKKKLLKDALAELVALMGSPEMRAEQDKKIGVKADTALTMATAWAKGRDNTAPSKRLYCWFFDLATQNGSLEGQTPKKVADFMSSNKPDKVDDLISDYLAGLKGSSGHVKDAHKNANLWRGSSDERLELLCLTYLRSATANPTWRHVVINRKGTIAVGKGWVNSGERNFSNHGL
ncbi:peptidoglycan-binding domain 1 protein [Rhizobium laguerreae]|uniref:peptidoglycan-binding domain 1 protein n=1 Tax=Rhizobium laguerreae TaxID=1076926 RepID=UPI001C91EB98|nr:peptidoglycan-binding domain 1 protein [Rhizobium laguerreae]MBY3300470.1 peptidoglycan-binding domain 1 protein [Rhizobium laguerreae]